MISTSEMTETEVRATIDTYLTKAMGPEYRTGQVRSSEDGRWGFTVLCQRDDMSRTPAVGTLWADPTTGQIEVLNDEQLREMREAGAVQAAQAHNELAKDENGYVLRRYARIQANVWISDRVGLKIKASGGTFVRSDPPELPFRQQLNAPTLRQETLLNDLRRALENGRLMDYDSTPSCQLMPPNGETIRSPFR
ncbi:hypothetical protein KFU94_00015 [Chloroflexi bacterium TSY]|nr:hypothetical protein [Chloroflexi bacterium TSY]